MSNEIVDVNFKGFVEKLKSITSSKIEDGIINYIENYVDGVSNGDEIEYADLTKEIFSSTDDMINELDYLNGSRDHIIEAVNENKNENFPKESFIKIIRHISLAIIQKDFILKNVLKSEAIMEAVKSQVADADKKLKDVEKALGETGNTLKMTKETLNETEESVNRLSEVSKATKGEVEKMEEIKGTIYTEFIAILGIFSALIFGLFGSFQGLSQAITDLVAQKNVGFLLVASSAITMCLTLLIFGLLQWVGRISGRRLVSCDCLSKQKCVCKHSLFQRHKTLFSIFLPLLVCFFIGLYILYFEYLVAHEFIKNNWYMSEQVINDIVVLFPIIILVIVVITIVKVVSINHIEK